jgi:hypothetical protein
LEDISNEVVAEVLAGPTPLLYKQSPFFAHFSELVPKEENDAAESDSALKHVFVAVNEQPNEQPEKEARARRYRLSDGSVSHDATPVLPTKRQYPTESSGDDQDDDVRIIDSSDGQGVRRVVCFSQEKHEAFRRHSVSDASAITLRNCGTTEDDIFVNAGTRLIPAVVGFEHPK